MSIFLAALLTIGSTAPVRAPSSNAFADAVDACRSIADAAGRLACFDRSVAALADARARREVVIVEKSDVRRARKTLFGFALPNFDLFGGDNDDESERIKQLDGKLSSIVPTGYNQFILTMEDGSSWETTDVSSSFSPRRGDRVIIKQAAFGYMAKSGYGQARVRRIR